MVVTNVLTEKGYIVITYDNGIPNRFAIADVLRAADIPALTNEQVSTIKTLSNLFVILIRTLISRGVLDNAFADTGGMDWDLESIQYAIEQMGGSFQEPQLDNALNDTAEE